MKKYQALIVGLVVSLLTFIAIVFNKNLNEIQVTVEETNTIVKDIQVTVHNTPYSLDNDYHCLASNIYWESRNQSLVGQMAVGHVALNRVGDSRYPETICGVVKQTKYYPSGGINLHDCQFSWYCDGKSDIPIEKVYEESFNLAVRLIQGRPIDVTEGSTHYHNTKVYPYWAKEFEQVTQIEDHIFYRSY